MSQSIRAFATLSLSTLVGVGLLAFRVTIPSRASAEEFHPIKEAEMPKGFPDYTSGWPDRSQTLPRIPKEPLPRVWQSSGRSSSTSRRIMSR